MFRHKRRVRSGKNWPAPNLVVIEIKEGDLAEEDGSITIHGANGRHLW